MWRPLHHPGSRQGQLTGRQGAAPQDACLAQAPAKARASFCICNFMFFSLERVPRLCQWYPLESQAPPCPAPRICRVEWFLGRLPAETGLPVQGTSGTCVPSSQPALQELRLGAKGACTPSGSGKPAPSGQMPAGRRASPWERTQNAHILTLTRAPLSLGCTSHALDLL